MTNDKAFQALSLCRRAGKLVMGFDPVADNVMRGRAQLVLLAADLSPKTAKRVQNFCEGLVPVVALPHTQAELAAIAHKPVGVFAVIDQNLAVLCKNSLTQTKEDR